MKKFLGNVLFYIIGVGVMFGLFVLALNIIGWYVELATNNFMVMIVSVMLTMCLVFREILKNI